MGYLSEIAKIAIFLDTSGTLNVEAGACWIWKSSNTPNDNECDVLRKEVW